MKKFIVLVIYDVVDNKTRNRLVKCLERYGVRVQKSAFEALLNRKQYDAMMRRASKMINPIEDSLRVYVLDDNINSYSRFILLRCRGVINNNRIINIGKSISRLDVLY